MTPPSDTVKCADCGEELASSARFCSACGRATSPISAPPLSTGPQSTESTSSIRPTHVADERKLVTALFADVVDSTAIAARMDPEDWAELMNRAFDQLTPTIQHNGGTIARLMGDALLAFFGAPAAHEDDPGRAVQAGLDLLDATRAFASDVRASHGVEFEIRVGINTGPAVLGNVGSDLKFEYTAMGDAVNLAARMQAAAQPMTVLISSETYRRVAQEFECLDRGPTRVKGKADPVHTYEVVKRATRKARAARPPVGGPGRLHSIESVIVGRDAEMTALQHTLTELRAGAGRLIGVLGEAGVGKSRLLAEFHKVAGTDVTWLEGHTLSFGRTIAFGPFREMLRDYAGVREDHSDTEAWEALQHRLAPLFQGELPEVLPYLGTLLGLTVREADVERVKYLDGDAIRPHVFRSVRRLVERLTDDAPVVLVFEDLHWLDQSSADLLEHLLKLVYTRPLLICGASRLREPGVGEGLRELAIARYEDRYTELRLAPLPATDSLQLIRNLLSHDVITSAVHGPILHKAEGNPFFIEEVIRSLIETRFLTWDRRLARWRAAVALDDLPDTIPDTIQGLIVARLDRLDNAAKEVLKIAAVLGRRFYHRVLVTVMAGSGRTDQEPLQELLRLELLNEWRQAPELELGFKHALTQEAAYQSIPLRQRQELHRRAGEAIEGLFPKRLDEFAAHLAYHYSQASDWIRAEVHLLKAGDQAVRVAADAEALAHYRQAIDVFGGRWSAFQRAKLERKLGEALFRMGKNTEARSYLVRALAELGTPTPGSQLALRASLVREATAEMWHFARPRPALLGPLAEPSDRVTETVEALRLLCWVDVWTDRERFVMEALQVLRVSARGGHHVGEIQALSALGMACDLVGAFWLAERLTLRALALARGSSHPIAIGTAHGAYGVHCTTRGELDAALRHFTTAGAAFQTAADIRSWGAVRDGHSLVSCLTGAFAIAIEQSRETIRLGEETGDRHLQGWGFHTLGEAVLHTSGPFEALPLLEKGLAFFRDVPDHLGVAHTLGLLAECAVRRGDLTQALAILEQGEEHLATYRVRGYSASALMSSSAHARVVVAQNASPADRPGAVAAARNAVAAALAHGSKYPIGLAAAQRWQGTLEWLEGRPARARRWWQRSMRTADKHGMRAESGLTLAEMAGWLEDPAVLRMASDTLQPIGAHGDMVSPTEELLRPRVT